MALSKPQPVIDPWVIDRSRDLLERAYLLFDNADGITDQPERFRQFYLAALRSSGAVLALSLIHISEPTRRLRGSRMPSSA